MPTKSEENKQVIRHLYDALGRGDTDSTSPGAGVKASKAAKTNIYEYEFLPAITLAGLG
jgi:ketosteroid isomerase-like protein